MKPLALTALLAPFMLLAILIGAVLTQAHHDAAIRTGPTISTSCQQHACTTSEKLPMTTLPTVTVYADAAHPANVNATRGAVTRWLHALEAPAAVKTALTMPYYSFAAHHAVVADKG